MITAAAAAGTQTISRNGGASFALGFTFMPLRVFYSCRWFY